MDERRPRAVRVLTVVVTYHSAEVLPGLLASLPAAMDGTPYDLTVVDNGSTDGTVETARALAPAARIVENGDNLGYAAGVNAGVRAGFQAGFQAASDHDAVLVLNPDVRLSAGCVPALVEALRTPGVGIAVPRLVDRAGHLIPSQRRAPTVRRALGDLVLGATRSGRLPAWGEVEYRPEAYEADRVTDWAEGSVQLISRACWERCGPWSESFFLYSEEADFDLRAGDLGFATLFVASASAVHLEGGYDRNPALWRLLVLNRVRLFHRRNGPAATAAYWAVLLCRELTRAALGRANSRAAAGAMWRPSRWRQRPGPEALS